MKNNMLSIKEAGRYSNFLQNTLQELYRLSWSGMEPKLVEKTVLHKKSLAKEGLEDEEILVKEEGSISEDVTLEKVVSLIDELMLEKALLTKEINLAKAEIEIEFDGKVLGLDSAIEYAKLSRECSELFYRHLLLNREEGVSKGYDRGYTFNVEGNQVSFQYETETTTKLLFDKEEYKEKEKEMLLKADSLSEEIDKQFTRKIVNFNPKHSYLDSVNDLLSKE